MRRLIDWLVVNEGLILILALVFILRIPAWYEPDGYGDEGIYLTLGEGLRRGLVWYRDLHDNKPPLLYLLAAISGNVFYFRILLTLAFGAAVAVFFKLMKLLLPKSEKSWYLSTLSLIILTTVFEGNIANAEIFMVLPTLMGMWLILSGKKLVKAGFYFSLAALLKVPAGFDWLAAFLFKPSLKLLLGFSVPILLTLVYYAVVGGFTPYLRSALLQNVGYLSSWGGSNQGLMWRGVGLAAGLTILWFLTKRWRLESKFKLITFWFLLALFGSLLSARPYPHYLIQPAVPAAILLGYFMAKKQLKLRAIIASLFLVSAAAYIQIGFWHYPILKYYQNFLSYAFGQKDQLNYW